MDTTKQHDWNPSWFENTIANTPAHITGLVVLLFVVSAFLLTGLVLVWSAIATPNIEAATQENQLVYQVQTGRLVMTVTRLAVGNAATGIDQGGSESRGKTATPLPQYAAQSKVSMAAR